MILTEVQNFGWSINSYMYWLMNLGVNVSLVINFHLNFVNKTFNSALLSVRDGLPHWKFFVSKGLNFTLVAAQVIIGKDIVSN